MHNVDRSAESMDVSNVWGTDEEYNEIMNEKLHIEYVPPEKCKIEGCRIVDISYILNQTIKLAEDHARKCTSGHLIIDNEVRKGCSSTINLKCCMCDKTYSCHSEKFDKSYIDSKINIGVVWGTLATGSTHKHIVEFLSTVDIPAMSSTLFYKIQNNLNEMWIQSAWQDMKAAGKEERHVAIERGQVDSDGVPWIHVYLDGGWSK